MSNLEAGPTQGLRLELPPDKADGVYSNIAFMHLTTIDATIDFCITGPGRTPKVVSRVQLSPQHLKALHEVIGRNLSVYETQVGEVPEPQLEPEQLPPTLGFALPKAPGAADELNEVDSNHATEN